MRILAVNGYMLIGVAIGGIVAVIGSVGISTGIAIHAIILLIAALFVVSFPFIESASENTRLCIGDNLDEIKILHVVGFILVGVAIGFVTIAIISISINAFNIFLIIVLVLAVLFLMIAIFNT